ncbi:MAG: IS256 family transposase, partial [Tissierellia bacterium]|nr:IS256 family transposase [Tissierellia bacterium]
FRSRDLSEEEYPFIWTDALYEKVRQDGRVVSMAILVVCGVNTQGQREILAIEPMLEESKETYKQLFSSLKERGLSGVQLVVSDAHLGLQAAIRESFPMASWQRCKVHFMRNIMAHVPHKEKESFAAQLKQIWLAPNRDMAYLRAKTLIETYQKRFPKAIETLEKGLEDSLQFFQFPEIDPRKISSTNLMERLNKEVRRRTKVVGIFPDTKAYLRLVTAFLIEYSEDWTINRAYIKKETMDKLKNVA